MYRESILTWKFQRQAGNLRSIGHPELRRSGEWSGILEERNDICPTIQMDHAGKIDLC